ncbi:hypothetical protein ACIHDR_19470 [Nocardia sp. NPDC052278]|uniref:hypothetical protein n=1 Tax=unclassified Nocardia TaxID=2637762 RepID=UPI0036870594
MSTAPEPNTPPNPRWKKLQRSLESLTWVRAGANAYWLIQHVADNATAASAIKAIAEAAAQALAAIRGLDN